MAILTIGTTETPPPLQGPAVLLINPKTAANVVNVHRLAACFGISQVWCTGSRVGQGLGHGRKTRLPPEERMRGFGNVDLIWCERAPQLFLAAGLGLAAVELSENATSLLAFDHQIRGADDIVYLFGPEDGSIPDELLDRCDVTVQIPTFHCLNLASAVAATLWDRAATSHRLRGTPLPEPRPDNRSDANPEKRSRTSETG